MRMGRSARDTLLLVVAFGAALVLLSQVAQRYDPSAAAEKEPDLVTGAQGAFPAALGAEVPAAPERVIRRTTGDEVLVHGLGLRSTDSGVRAVNVRTGEGYWRYERRDATVTGAWFKASERTVVVWFPDRKLAAVDLRTGKPLWHTRIPRAESRRPATGTVGGGQVVIDVPDGLRALSERDGRTLWTVKPRRSCDETPVRSAYAFPDRLTVIRVSCDTLSAPKKDVGPVSTTPDVEKSSELLLGVDDRTGALLWERPSRADDLAGGDEDTLVALGPDRLTPRVDLLDVSRAGVSERGEVRVRETWATVAGDGLLVSYLDPEIYDIESNTLLSAYDLRDGHPLWTLRAPSRQAFGEPAIADGRVYVVRQTDFRYGDAGTLTGAALLVLDADTGRPLHTLRLPDLTAPERVDSRTVLDVVVADGAVTIRWRSGRKEQLVVTG